MQRGHVIMQAGTPSPDSPPVIETTNHVEPSKTWWERVHTLRYKRWFVFSALFTLLPIVVSLLHVGISIQARKDFLWTDLTKHGDFFLVCTGILVSALAELITGKSPNASKRLSALAWGLVLSLVSMYLYAGANHDSLDNDLNWIQIFSICDFVLTVIVGSNCITLTEE